MIIIYEGSNKLTFTIPSQLADIATLEYLDICKCHYYCKQLLTWISLQHGANFHEFVISSITAGNEMTGRIPSVLEQLVANATVTFVPGMGMNVLYGRV